MPDAARSDPPGAGSATTRHLLLARSGDRDSLGWLIERFDPCLHAAARHHLGTNLRRFGDPEDLVSEVWTVALRRLPELWPGEPPSAPSFLKFLGTTLRFTLNNWIRKHLKSGHRRVPDPAPGDGEETGDQLDRLPADVTGVTTKVRLSEGRASFAAALAELDPKDREVIVLRALEQIPNQEAAVMLGVEPGTVAVRYHRALTRLRARLPASIFAELSPDSR